MDWLEEAKKRHGRIDGTVGGKAQGVIAISASLIAIAERLGQLVSIREAETGYGPIEVVDEEPELGVLKGAKVVGCTTKPFDDEIPY